MPKKKSYLTVTDQFCGAGGSSLGAAASGMEIVLAMNHWQLAIETHNTNFPDTLHDCADVSATDPRRYSSTDILVTSPECFPVGTLILTKERLKAIEDVEIGDLVLTHKNRWRRVNYIKTSFANTIVIKGRGHVGLETTATHPFYIADSYVHWIDRHANKWERRLHTPRWVNAGEVTKGEDFSFWASPHTFGSEQLSVPQVAGVEFDAYFWWMVGRWLGDGNLRKRHKTIKTPKNRKRPARPWPAPCEVCGETAAKNPRHPHLANFTCGPKCDSKRYRTKSKGSSFHICCSYDEADELIEKLSCCESFTWRRRDMRTAVLYSANSNELVDWFLANFGEKAHGKRLPTWVLTMPEWARRSLLDGYVSADGSFDGRKIQTSTVSKELAFGIRLLALSLGYEPTMGVNKRTKGVIEGRKVNMRLLYSVNWLVDPKVRRAQRDELHSWGMIKNVLVGNEQVPVLNLGVDEDESYVADGIVVHNCTNHSIAKGSKRRSKQMSLFGEAKIDPSAERSRATMWDVPRFAEYHNYNIIVVENVVDARHWIMWDAWIHAMDSLGYDYQIVYFNSQFAHLDPGHVANLHDFAPQSRDRMYVVFHKKGNKAPDLDFRPKAHCPSCDRIIEARQVFKPTPKVRELGGRWGRYGDQYVYICESCSLKGKDVVEVTPFYFAAANAIDWSLPAERIGDKKRPLKDKTRERVRKGIEMFGHQYLMIELAHSHGLNNRARPVSGQLFTQTAAQTQALLMPWLVLNYSPGYVKAITDTLGSVTTQDHHALVLPDAFLTSVNDFDPRNIPMDGVMGTQTTQTKWALTIPPHMIELRGTNRPKGIDDPLDTIAASGNHHGLVMGAPFLMSYYGSNGNQRLVDEAMGTVTATERHALVQVPFLLGYANGDGPAKTAVDPLRTVHTENGQALAQPHGIEVDDCYFRMLQPHEIGRGMAFPEDYTVLGNKREQVRQYGNAVTPVAMRQILQRCAATFN